VAAISWETSFDAALRKAGADGMAVLVDFFAPT
jgi:hypothetical protein